SVPHEPTNVLDPPIDFLAFSGHKLFGPSGIGVLWGRRELLEAMDPFLCGGHMISEVYLDHSTWAPLPAKFEAGTIPIAQAIALGAAIDYVESVGWSAIHEHERQLLQYAWNRLAEVPGLRVHGPDVEHRGPILAFTIEGAHPEDLAQLLNLKGVFVRHGHHCTMPLHDHLGVPATVRASLALYNSREDIDALMDAIQFARKKLRLTEPSPSDAT
ncbi:MAG TPA: aminotransferase class V-fold PLP-dependent enzyme, partial [Planctomycetaceae bacterium]|nr:aminotransferase class V-fold PLP-dependent enzyme [Planctomycetaceae bacterium]